jgi:hypothetical protein
MRFSAWIQDAEGNMPFPQDRHIFDLYRFSQDQKTFIFDASLPDYEHIFNHLDPSPFRKRDLSPDLLSYLDQCSADIPLKYKIQILFNLTSQSPDPGREKEVVSGVKNNFLYNVNYFEKQILRTRMKALVYIILSFCGISAAAASQDFFQGNIFFGFLREGLTIGGWVFLWEAFSTLFIQLDDVYDSLKKFKRLLNCEILFTYSSQNSK